MKFLIVGDDVTNYPAKCHHAFRVGMKQMFDTTMYGSGFPEYDEKLSNFPDIVKHYYGSGIPDVIFTHINFSPKAEEMLFPFPGLEKIASHKVIPVSDYWYITDEGFGAFEGWIKEKNITAIASYYPQLIELYKNTSVADKFIWVPPTFDPALFNDWGLPKTFDVGFIGSGVDQADMSFYPERWQIGQQLASNTKFSYLTTSHPGWETHKPGHPQYGRGFSENINRCRIFIATGGKPNLALARYFETMASRAALFAIEPVGHKELGLVDGLNYVKITPENVLEKIEYFLRFPDLLERITENGYCLAMEKHNCFARAYQFYDRLKQVTL